MSDISNRSIDRDDVTGDGVISINFVEHIVLLDVSRVSQLKCFSLFAGTLSPILDFNQRVIVPVNPRLKHIVLLFKERVRGLNVVKIIGRYQR